MSLKEILATFAINVQGLAQLGQADVALGKTEKGAVSLTDSIRKLSSAFGVALGAGAFGMWVNSFAQGAGEVRALSMQLGQNAQDVQAWMAGAEMMGSKAGDVENALFSLTESIGMAGDAASANGERAQALKALGFDVKTAEGEAKTMNQILAELSDSFGKIEDPVQKAYLAQQIMGDAGVKLLPVLDGIVARTEELQATGGGYSPEALAAVANYQTSLVKLKFAWSGLQSQFFSAVEPALTKLGQILSAVAGYITRLIDGTHLLQSVFIAITPILYSLGAAALAAMWPAIAVFAKWALVIAVASLLIDDFWKWWEGKPSAFGKIMDDMFGEGSSDKVRSFVKDTAGQLGILWDKIAGGAQVAVAAILKVMSLLNRAAAASDRFFGVKNDWADKLADEQAASSDEYLRAAKDNLWREPEDLGGASLPGPRPIGPPTADMMGVRYSQEGPPPGQGLDARTQTVNVNVNGAGDPMAIARGIVAGAARSFDTKSLVAQGVPAI